MGFGIEITRAIIVGEQYWQNVRKRRFHYIYNPISILTLADDFFLNNFYR